MRKCFMCRCGNENEDGNRLGQMTFCSLRRQCDLLRVLLQSLIALLIHHAILFYLGSSQFCDLDLGCLVTTMPFVLLSNSVLCSRTHIAFTLPFYIQHLSTRACCNIFYFAESGKKKNKPLAVSCQSLSLHSRECTCAFLPVNSGCLDLFHSTHRCAPVPSFRLTQDVWIHSLQDLCSRDFILFPQTTHEPV